MTPQKHCERIRGWVREQANSLPPEAKQKVLRALEERVEMGCFGRLYQLHNAGEVPDSWRSVLDDFWGFAR
jgi:hypothetical protein